MTNTNVIAEAFQRPSSLAHILLCREQMTNMLCDHDMQVCHDRWQHIERENRLTSPAYQAAMKRVTSLCSCSRLSRSSSEASSACHRIEGEDFDGSGLQEVQDSETRSLLHSPSEAYNAGHLPGKLPRAALGSDSVSLLVHIPRKAVLR